MLSVLSAFFMKLDSTLQKCGLSPKESKLYLAALELGSGSVQAIARKAGVVRSTAYEVLEALRERRFVSTFQKRHVRYYSAEDPDQLIRLTTETLDLLKAALPQLTAFVGTSRRRPTVRFYEGVDGMKTVFNEVLDEARELIGFGSADDIFGEIKDFKRFVEKRIKKKIPAKVILRDTPLALERKKLGPQELREVRIVPTNHTYSGLIYIWKTKVAFFAVAKDPMAVVIESPEIAETQRALFYNLWDLLGGRHQLAVKLK